MNEAEKILAIMLSSFLALFLLLSIVALSKFIQILSSVKRITVKAESVAGSVEHVSEFFEHTAGTVAVGRLIANITHSYKKGQKRGKE